METTRRTRVIVEGRVQGVYFRDSTRAEAERLGLAGWVRNLADGTVEAVFEGSAEGIASAIAWAHEGPVRAVVTHVAEFPETPEGLTGFRVRY